jgi:hypothetical protein
VNFDERLGTVLSVVMHVAILGVCVWLFRNPITTTIVAAGEGQGSGESVIEVGVVEAGQLGFTLPRAISFVGQEQNTANNDFFET